MVNNEPWVAQHAGWLSSGIGYPIRLVPLYNTVFENGKYYKYQIQFRKKYTPVECDTFGVEV